jgi:D-3-phosphoglycerate dehydrogenase
MKILVLAQIHPDGIALLQKRCEVIIATGLSEEEIIEKIRGCNAVIVRSKPKITKAVIDAGDSLQVIGRAGVGLDNVDTEHARSKGITVVNTPAASTESVAEHVFALLLSKARDIPRADHAMREGKWIKKDLMGIELQGKTLGVIGFGQIGSRLGEIAAAFGMSVLAYDVIDVSERAQQVGARVVSMDEVLSESDFISLHVPLLPSTRNLISQEEIGKMKEKAILVNTSRGGIIDEKALQEALTKGKIQAALDVFENEPPTQSPLLTTEGIVLTPHIAGSTEEAQMRAGIEIARRVIQELNLS